MKVLIVEDNAVMRRLIAYVVGDLADSIVECDDGAEALAAYERHRPDWVLMDIEMPRVDGLTATRRITRAYPNAAIIIVSNYDDAFLRTEARAAGARVYLLKENLTEVHAMLRPTNQTGG